MSRGRMIKAVAALVLVSCLHQACSFSVRVPQITAAPRCSPAKKKSTELAMLLPDTPSSILTAAVEVFDGSTIKDTVVVSSSYWTNLKAQLSVLLTAQFAAIVAFAAVATVTAQQSPKLVDQLGNNLNASLSTENEDRPAIKKLKVPLPEGASPSPSLDLSKLATCIALDFLGSASELIPLWGEAVDVVYAPLAAYLLRTMFGGSNVAFFIELGEEILPFTDLLPFCTICWLIDTFAAQSDIAQTLQLGSYKPDLLEAMKDATDVTSANNNANSREKTGS